MSKDKKSGWNPETVDNHPAGVAVRFNRVHGTMNFFGQTMPSDNFVVLTVTKAHMNHDLGRDWLAGDQEIIEVALSPVQFAELITTMNIGVGVCGTMLHLNGERIERYEPKSTPFKRAEEYGNANLEAMTETMNNMVADFEKTIDESKLSKKQKDEIKGSLYHLKNFQSNFKFYQDQFKRAVENVKVEAKAELDAYITHKIQGFGLEVLEQKKALLQIEKKEK